MSERSELRRRREERMENGVKNLKGARLFPITFSNHGFGEVPPPIDKNECFLYFNYDLTRTENSGRLAQR